MHINFLNSIERLSNDNLIAESLAYILNHPEFSIYQKIFYSHLLSIADHKDTEEWEFEISTQDFNQNFGIPDLVIQNDNLIIIIENKFWAEFSQNDQYWRYTQILLAKKDFEKKFLVLLCLKCKLDYFKIKIYNQFQSKGIAMTNESELISYLNMNGITPIFIIWEDIIDLFKSNNLLTQSMEFFINSRYINLIKMQKDDLVMLNSKIIPNFLFSLWGTVDQVKGILLEEKFNVGRTGQSRSFYGYTIYFDWGSLWFGQYIEA
ncbi:MAG: PD-(D/E)XK nuclease family protein [Leptospiraceae bacterium]|nr:PD-(D/E)XK nuclease family protein [Leptospiraceae bacterium]